MSSHRLRIFSSLLIAFVIVKIYANFTDVKNLLTNFKLPSYNFGKLFTLNFGPSSRNDNNLTMKQFNNPDGSINYNYISPIPTPTPIINHPSSIISKNPTPTSTSPRPSTYVSPTKIPTNIPKPTNTPKPTKVPPPPPITSDVRPGTTLRGVFEEAGKRGCMPAALLLAFQTEETGAWIDQNESSSFIKIYNTYGWWITGAGNPCTGFGYNTATGRVPADSVNAGYRCQNGVGSEDIGIMGVLQISQFEQDATRKYTLKYLPNNIDRRVLFDNALIFAIATNNRIGVTPKNCTVWTDDEVRLAAEKHYGSCYISATRNYCNEVLRLYKQYR